MSSLFIAIMNNNLQIPLDLTCLGIWAFG
ncbi:hypothetical protein V2J09_004184 [Rumex salicifolius]